MKTTRRTALINGMAAVSALAAPALALAAPQRVVVVGGGFGGATAAKYLKILEPRLDVTLVERDRQYITCPFSNLVLAGMTEMSAITYRYDNLGRYGVNVVHEEVTGIDGATRKVTLGNGTVLDYERLILSPGIDINYGGLPGYSEAAAQVMPHAWKAGPQTTLLRKQLEEMPDGGTVIIVAPDNPYRCPPGPYERAALIGHYLKSQKPRSKLLIFDPKERFSKQGLFLKAYESVYPGMIQWVGGGAGGKVTRVDPGAMTVETGFGDEKGHVINVIPPQRAGRIAQVAGVADAKGWCPVDPKTMESKQVPGIHVIGDASIAGAMPKSATAANSQAKVAAAAIVAMLHARPTPEPSYANTCYSLISPDYGISVTGVYGATPEGIKEIAGGVSPLEAARGVREAEAAYTQDWYRGITFDAFA